MITHTSYFRRPKYVLLTLCLLMFCSGTGPQPDEQSFADEPKADNSKAKATVPLLVALELPRIKVREYHRPYVAAWIEEESRELVQHVSVWYQQGANAEGHGKKWLPDLRQWWRRGGRKMDDAVDAVTGATRSAGRHRIRVTNEQLSKLKPGKYNIVVEASREVGGRELVRLPFSWPPTKVTQAKVSGKTELGQVSIQLTPQSAD